MKRALIAAAALASIVGFAGAASAQDMGTGPEMEAGVKFGFNTMTGSHGDAFDSALSGGLALAYYFTPDISLEGSWLYHKHDQGEDAQEALNELATETMNMAALTDLRLTMNEFALNGHLYAPLRWPGSRAYLLAGVGLVHWKLDGKTIALTDFAKTEEESFWDFAVNIGGGLDYAVTEEVKLGAELVYTYVIDDFDDGLFNFLATVSYGFTVPL